MQILHPNYIKENLISGREYLLSIILNNINEYAESNSASRERRNLLISNLLMSVKFNPITVQPETLLC